jgi:hypothetical protein
MLLAFGLTCALILIAAAVHSELRSASYGIVLSNGVEVLVNPEMYREVLCLYRVMDDPDEWARWDQAVLDILRPERPLEWKFLVRSLGYQVSAEGFGTHRRLQAAKNGRIHGLSPRP